MGTVGYMSPEQIRGNPVDARTDIFSFGAVLYEMLAGRKAFHRESTADTISAMYSDENDDHSMIVANQNAIYKGNTRKWPIGECNERR
jgi:serine/threonine protein kinase